jgi:hypothetical protein
MRELERVPRELQDKHTLSWRERNNIFEEIERGKK